MSIILLILLSTGSVSFAKPDAELISLLHKEAVKKNLDPDFVVAVATVESSLNRHAVGLAGEVGPLQVKPGNTKIVDWKHAVRMGVEKLAEARASCPTYPYRSWVNCYNLGIYYKKLRYPTKFVYYRKVMKEYTRIKFSKYLRGSNEKFNHNNSSRPVIAWMHE